MYIYIYIHNIHIYIYTYIQYLCIYEHVCMYVRKINNSFRFIDDLLSLNDGSTFEKYYT